MGCQCTNQEEEDKNELLKKEKNVENEKYQENNNHLHKDRIFGLENTDIDNSGNMHDENNLKYENNPELEQEENYSQNEKLNEEKLIKYSEYSEEMLSLINKIREDPVSYAEVIEESIENIIEEQDKIDESKSRLIYKKKVKVALKRGEPAFREAAEELRNMEPLLPLEFKSDICVPLPEVEEDIKDSSYLRQQVKILRENNNNIDVFFKDLIKVPEVSALLMVVDDTGKNPGKKRKAVLNKDFKYIGISSTFIGKTFIAYFSFSK